MIEEVRKRLAARKLPWRFQVLEGSVRRDGGWWYVPVAAKSENGVPATREAVITAYADIENDIQEETHTNILFVPAEL